MNFINLNLIYSKQLTLISHMNLKEEGFKKLNLQTGPPPLRNVGAIFFFDLNYLHCLQCLKYEMI